MLPQVGENPRNQKTKMAVEWTNIPPRSHWSRKLERILFTTYAGHVQLFWIPTIYDNCFAGHVKKTTRWLLLRVYNSFRAAFWDRFAAVNCSKVKPFIGHNQKKCCNLWSCMNLRKSWIFMNPWSKSPQEHVLHVRQEARKGRPFNPAFSGFTKNQVKIPQIPPYEQLSLCVTHFA